MNYAFTDLSRVEVLGDHPGTPREIMVHVWYPTKPGLSARLPAAPYLPGFDAARPKLSADDIRDLFRPSSYKGHFPKTHIVENAPILPGKGHFPVLVFSHGWGNPTFLYTAELEDIVSHGYIVAAVDHPHDTIFTQFPDGHLVFFAQKNFDAAVKKTDGFITYARERVEVMAQDNRFALTMLLRYAKVRALHAPFFERIDEAHVGAFGHSIGGLTAARECQTDNRVKACMDQDSDDDRGSPFIATDLTVTERQPFLLFVAASADETSPRVIHPDDTTLESMKITRAEYDVKLKKHQSNQLAQLAGIPGGAYRITLYDLPGFSHRSFTDQSLLPSAPDPEQSAHNFHVVQTFTFAFFDKYLKGDRHTVFDTGKVVDRRVTVESFPAH